MPNPATAAINTPERAGDFIRNAPIEAATILFVGTLAARNAAGNVVPASDAANLTVLGRVEPNPDGFSGDYDNSGGAAGAINALIKRGVFKYTNSTGDAVGATELGKIVYVEDDQTVNKSGGTNAVRAGRLVEIDADGGLWVDTKAASGPGNVTLTSAQVATANASDLASAEALANALKTAYNALQADVAAINAKLK